VLLFVLRLTLTHKQLEYHPRYFSDPDEFKPARWYADRTNNEDPADSEEHTAFSVGMYDCCWSHPHYSTLFEGPRACQGKKFATTEAVCLLALLLRDWHVEPLLSVNVSTGEKETVEEWRARVMQPMMGITMGIKDVPLTFTRRL
jgi:cytochrome P450